jgi:hypothetical protein
MRRDGVTLHKIFNFLSVPVTVALFDRERVRHCSDTQITLAETLISLFSNFSSFLQEAQL